MVSDPTAPMSGPIVAPFMHSRCILQHIDTWMAAKGVSRDMKAVHGGRGVQAQVQSRMVFGGLHCANWCS